MGNLPCFAGVARRSSNTRAFSEAPAPPSACLPPPQAQLLISLVPCCRGEPDGARCRELYELLSEFLSKGNVDARSLCAALPALYPPRAPSPPPPPAAESGPHADSSAGDAIGSVVGGGGGGGGGGQHAGINGPLPGPASPEERELSSAAAAALSEAVAADGFPGQVQVVPLLVWLMRLIVEPRVTPSDAHLSGLLGIARIIIGPLGPRGKEAVGLWGLEGIVVGGGGGGGGGGRPRGLLHHVYHECLFDIATHDNHGPLAPPKCRWVVPYVCSFR